MAGKTMLDYNKKWVSVEVGDHIKYFDDVKEKIIYLEVMGFHNSLGYEDGIIVSDGNIVWNHYLRISRMKKVVKRLKKYQNEIGVD